MRRGGFLVALVGLALAALRLPLDRLATWLNRPRIRLLGVVTAIACGFVWGWPLVLDAPDPRGETFVRP